MAWDIIGGLCKCFMEECCDATCIEDSAVDDCWCGETDGFDPGAMSESECAAAGCHYYGSPHHWCECDQKKNCASVGGEWECDVFGPVAVKGFPPPEVCDHDEDEDCGSDATSGSDADVTCSLVINDEITAVYVDGQEVTGSLCGEWPATLRFSSAASLFAISGYDNEGGCQYGGFAMRCTTADGTGPWHGLTADTQNWRASNWVSGSSWTQPGFDDSAWQTPSVGGEPQYGSDLVGGGDTICVEGDFYFRRTVGPTNDFPAVCPVWYDEAAYQYPFYYQDDPGADDLPDDLGAFRAGFTSDSGTSYFVGLDALAAMDI